MAELTEKEKDDKIVFYLSKIVQDLGDKNYEEIVKNVKLLLEIDVKADYYGIIGLAEFKLKNYEDAIKHLNQANNLSPRADYYCNLGMAKDVIGDKDGALSAFEKAIELNPNSDYYYSNRGMIKYDLGNYFDAILDYNRAIELGPNEDTYYGMRGLSKFKSGMIDEAAEDYKKAISLKSDEIEYYYRLANIYLLKKDYNGATLHYEKMLSLCTEQGGNVLDPLGVSYLVKCYLRYARVKVAQGDYQAAQEMITKSIEIDPSLDVDNAGD